LQLHLGLVGGFRLIAHLRPFIVLVVVVVAVELIQNQLGFR
jgi:hypothetical protein